MSYIDEILGRDEAVHYRARFPAVLYAGSWFLLIVFAGAGVLFAINGFGWLGPGIAAVGLMLFLAVMLPIWTTEIGVTTQRFIYKRGIIWRTSQELQLRSIEEVDLEQTFFGRVFNHGRVALHGTGVGDIKLPGLAEPVLLQRAIQEAIGAATQANLGPLPAGEPAEDRPRAAAG